LQSISSPPSEPSSFHGDKSSDTGIFSRPLVELFVPDFVLLILHLARSKIHGRVALSFEKSDANVFILLLQVCVADFPPFLYKIVHMCLQGRSQCVCNTWSSYCRWQTTELEHVAKQTSCFWCRSK
jgi:hypothetical protein